jgi:hypothetical protein
MPGTKHRKIAGISKERISINMAEKRMFTQKIIDSDSFLDMPLSTQALYFHLNMRADDDGFVNNPKKLQRYIGAGDDDLKLLLAKRFVIGFESGVIVIKHWRMHNTLRKDRYSPTCYQEELALLDVKENKAYTERENIGCQMVAKRLPSGCHSIVEDSVDKISIGEGRGEEGHVTACGLPCPAETVVKPTLEEVIDYVESCQMTVNPMRFYTYYRERDWKTVNGSPIQWRQKLQEWDFDDRQKAAAQQQAAPAAAASAPSSNPFLEMAKEEGIR